MSDDNEQSTEPEEDHRLVAERRRKLDALREAGFGYPNDRRRTALAGQIVATFQEHTAEHLDEEAVEVSIGGRLMAKRVMGKNTFAKIQDRSGQVQIFVQRDVIGTEAYQAFKKWDLGDIAWACGTVFRTKAGEITVKVDEIELLTKSLRPLPEKFHGLTDQETRYRQRYVDLIVTEESRRVFRTRTRVVQYIRSYLDAMDFMEVETPMMQPIPGGAVARPFVTHHNALKPGFLFAYCAGVIPEATRRRRVRAGLRDQPEFP